MEEWPGGAMARWRDGQVEILSFGGFARWKRGHVKEWLFGGMIRLKNGQVMVRSGQVMAMWKNCQA